MSLKIPTSVSESSIMVVGLVGVVNGLQQSRQIFVVQLKVLLTHVVLLVVHVRRTKMRMKKILLKTSLNKNEFVLFCPILF